MYRVAYGTSGGGRAFRAYDDRKLATLAHAEKLRRSYKRAGFWSWVEDEHGNFVPVPGALRASIQKSYPKR